MYINNYDKVPLWAWGKDLEDIGSNRENLEITELRYSKEEDLLCDLDFIMEDFI